VALVGLRLAFFHTRLFMDIKEAARQLRKRAEDNPPFQPFARQGLLPTQNQVLLTLEGWQLSVQLTRTQLSAQRLVWQLSIGKYPDGKIDQVPESFIEAIKQEVLPNGQPIPSVMGNCRQFMEFIS